MNMTKLSKYLKKKGVFKLKERYFVEYSVSQQCFHIDTVNRTFMKNLELALNNISNDYQVIAIAENYDEANNIVYKVRKELKSIREKI